MSLSTALSIAATGLRTYSRMSEVGANNIANADVEGFVRKEADLSSLVRDGQGVGVAMAGILRQASAPLARDARREAGLAAFLDVQAETLGAYAVELGQPNEERSISSALAKLENAFISLAESPESSSLQRDVVQAAKDLASNLNGLSDTISHLRENAETQIQAEVDGVNDALSNLKRVNDQIKLQSATGQDTTALEDQRDRLIDTIAESIPIREIRRAPNDIMLLTEQGVTLFDGNPAEIGFTRSAAVPGQAIYDPSGSADPGYVDILSGLTIDGRDVAPGSGDPQALTSGRIAGLFTVRDDVLVQFQRQIDQLASAVADLFQANDPSLAAGSAGLFTDGGAAHDRTDPAQIVGLSGRIAVNAAVDPDQGGAVWRVRDGVGATSPGVAGDATQAYQFLAAFDDSVSYPADSGLPATLTLRASGAEIVGAQQSMRANAEARADGQATVAKTLQDARVNATGVNVDEELQRMLEIEKSYAANANVIQSTARMLDELLSII